MTNTEAQATADVCGCKNPDLHTLTPLQVAQNRVNRLVTEAKRPVYTSEAKR